MSLVVHGLAWIVAWSAPGFIAVEATVAAEMKRDAASGSFDAQWQALIEAARKEERFTVDAGTGNAPHWRPIVQWFSKKFGVRAVTASGDNVAERIVAEQRGGRFLANVIFESNRGGNTMLIPAKAVQPIEPLLIHPEVADKKRWWQSRWWWSDDEALYMFNFAAEAHDSPIADLYINTDIVKPEKIRNREKFSFWDILDPEQPWADKIMSEPPSGGLMSRWGRTLLVPELGEKWVRAMITHPKIKWQPNRRLQVDGLFSGEYALTIMTTGTTQRSMDQLRERGAPFKRLLEVVTLTQSRTIGGAGNHGQIMVAKNPASPNATKLFLNWLLSWEGQKVRQELAEGEVPPPTLRIDNVPAGRVRPQDQIKPGLKYIMVFGSKEVEAEVERGRVLAGDIWKCVQLKGPSNC
jgi:ABC-type Fe3+ transport system substrate-binding protein